MAKILVIDDEEDMCWALEKALQEDGFEVLTANSGLVGLTSFTSNVVDLVLLDMKLLDMNGLEVLAQIRQKNVDIPVLMMTGYSSLDIALQAIEKGATGYLTKPINMRALKEVAHKSITEK